MSAIMAAIPMASAEITSDPFLVEEGGTAALTSGAVGTDVDVVGNATSGAADPFAVVTIYLDSLAGTVLGTGTADNTGAYTITITVPAAEAGDHWIIANDGETESGGALFTVEPALVVDTIPSTFGLPNALPGDSISVMGDGFAADSDITLFLNSTTLGTPASYVITTPAITTDGNGSFDATVAVPAIPFADFDVYDVNATDEDANSAIDQLEVDYYINCVPPAGPTGITTTISGRIAPDVAYTITFNAAAIATGTTASDGAYSNTYTIPGVLSPAGYPVTITWATVNTRSTTFTVTPAPTITLSEISGMVGYNFTVSGSGFSGNADITFSFDGTVVNSTAMDEDFGPTSSGGSFTDLDFTVPALAPGVYAVSVVDEFGAMSASGVYFTIVATPVTIVEPRATSYYPMDIPSFNIWTTEVSLGTITVSIYDPNGQLWWRTSDWTLTTSDDATYKSVMFQNEGADDYNQMRIIFPADAPLGAWNWTITYTPTSTATLTTKTGIIMVMMKPSMQTVIDKVDECCANMSDLLDDLEASIRSVVTDAEGDLTAVINTKTGQITTKLDALNPKLQNIEDVTVIIATDLGEVKADIADLDMTALDADITAIKGDTATIKTNIGTVNTAVSALGASVSALEAAVSSVSGDVATVETKLGTLEGTVSSIDGAIATIDTEVGTIKAKVDTVGADVSDVKAKPDVDMTPVWIAVVLSLIAAIAAIFAVITIRQKIAG
jgi:archaellum component FlaC